MIFFSRFFPLTWIRGQKTKSGWKCRDHFRKRKEKARKECVRIYLNYDSDIHSFEHFHISVRESRLSSIFSFQPTSTSLFHSLSFKEMQKKHLIQIGFVFGLTMNEGKVRARLTVATVLKRKETSDLPLKNLTTVTWKKGAIFVFK